MVEQLDFDGQPTPYPLPRPRALTARQRDLLRYVRVQPRGILTRQARRFYACPSAALRRLESLGLVERVAYGFWRAR